MSDKGWRQLLGLMQRAGKLVTGEELVVKSIQNNKVHLVIVASDASDNTKKKITDKCTYYNIPYIIFENRFVIGQAIGKAERVAVAVQDKGFANKFRSKIE
ncbi:YlxQ family RNA-binding protein [Salipaludibacillus sp. CUR1]|uniref:YlxQ family RNA-binding protein n=1 Tax=Salipaludibacillus sp. CUR1 TaxID=2820003 RepID=UPI001E3F13C3|nr:YlxQ family RNA-binding protein [Salipaludibacillus sp. CUR1]MCE7794564.1 YlxQ family RNA-binding protein [Salipaludibacillus sp. CUR1]